MILRFLNHILVIDNDIHMLGQQCEVQTLADDTMHFI